MTSVAREPRRNRDAQILEAAVQIFSEKGYAAASLQDVADAVGLLKGSLYHYISSKESLLHRIFLEAHEQARQLMDELDALDLPPDEHLRQWARRLTVFYLDNPERASLYFSEWRHLTGDELDEVQKQRREFATYFSGILNRAKKEGLARKDLDVKLATFYLMAAINGVLIWYKRGGSMSASRIADEVASLSVAATLLPRDAS
jgi:AcrR family transcriptional regulator